jgi:hypothetical protein
VKDDLTFDQSDLKGLSLLGTPIERCHFISCLWPKNDERNVLYDARMVESRGYFKISNFPSVEHWENSEEVPPPYYLEDLFRRLKKVARDEHDEMLASDWHYNEKEMQRLRLARSEDTLTWQEMCQNLSSFQLVEKSRVSATLFL